MAVFRRSENDADLRFMARCRYGQRFFPTVDHIGRFACQPGNESRIDFHDDGLFRAEAAADTRFDDPNLGFGDFKGMGNDAAHMERYLRRADDGQPSECIFISIGSEGFHGCLLILTSVIRPVDDDV